LLDFLRIDPVMKPLSIQLEAQANAKFSDPNELFEMDQQRLNIPKSEADCTSYYYRLLSLYASEGGLPGFTTIFRHGSGFQDWKDEFMDQVLLPFHRLLDEQIDDGDFLLYMLSRYQ